jgi:polysaccharide biosynthesis transport protein
MADEIKITPMPVGHGSTLMQPTYPPSAFNAESGQQHSEFDWERLARVIQKHWRLSFAFTLFVFIATLLIVFRMKDTYSPVSRIEIDPPGSDVFSLKDLMTSQSDDQDYVQTQIEILQSDELAIAAIRTLLLDKNADIVGKQTLDKLADQSDSQSPTGNRLTPLENAALRAFHDRLSINLVRNSRLVEVSFTAYTPNLASDVTNTLVSLFIDRNYRKRYEATMQASEWLQNQLTDLRRKVERSNEALVSYQRANGIVEMENSQNPVTQKLGDLNHQLTQAQADRIQLEAYVRMIKSGSADSLPAIRNNLLLQNLTQHYVEVRGQLAEAQAIYGKNHANVKRLQGQVDELQEQVTAERQRVIHELMTSYESALERERLTSQALDEMKKVVSGMNEKMIQYNVLRNEAQASTDLYNVLFARLKEAGISAGLKSSNIRVVDEARVLDRPTGPHRLRNIAIGLLMGLLGGVGLAFFVESLDNTIRTPDDIKNLVGLSSLAMLPQVGVSNGKRFGSHLPNGLARLVAGRPKGNGDISGRMVFLEAPNSPQADAVQSLRTSIMLSRPGQPPRTILVVSPSPGEGKTTVALNLAAVLTQHGTTCIVDADLRRPMIARSLNVPYDRGLSQVLTGSAELEDVLQSAPGIANLKVLPVGPIPPNPGELIASEQMRRVLERLAELFKFVILDSPPILPFADARALSVLTDGVIIVGKFGGTTRQAICRSFEILTELRAPILGVVLNGVDMASPDYYYYHYGYGYSRKYGYTEGERYGAASRDLEDL